MFQLSLQILSIEKKWKLNAVDCFKVMVKKKHVVTVTMIGLVLVIRNKKWKEILYLYACGYRPYQNCDKIICF